MSSKVGVVPAGTSHPQNPKKDHPSYKRDFSKPFDAEARAEYRKAMNREHKRMKLERLGKLACCYWCCSLCGCNCVKDGLHNNELMGSVQDGGAEDDPDDHSDRIASCLDCFEFDSDSD